MTKEIELDSLVQKVSRKSHPVAVFAAGALVLVLMNVARVQLRRRELERQAELSSLAEVLEQSSESLGDATSLRDMKLRDLERFKTELSKLTNSRRALYEGGIQLQEELRVLEKQWEIVSTYLLVDEGDRKIHLMRGDQSLESYPIGFVPPEVFGEGATAPPPVSVIISKERFAHPERPKSEQVDGQLQWEPPQVGTSQRANALGEYVMFTRGSLILHGPPKKAQEHTAFAHYCLGLSLAVARRLYESCFIGTKIVIKPAPGAAKH